MKIAIDVRHVKDFGIGTYIRSLVQALGVVDSANRYVLIGSAEAVQSFHDLPQNFETAVYKRPDTDPVDNVGFPAFLHRFAADLVHIPLNRVPLLMPRPYVVTIHDMSSLLFEERKGPRQDWHRFRFRTGLMRAERVIVVSAATRKDVENLLFVPHDKIRMVYNAPNPEFFRHRHVADARAAGPEAAALERRRILERYQIHYPFLLYAGSIRPQKNVPRLVEAFAVAREELEQRPEYKDLHLIIIGDEISDHPEVRRTVIQSRVEHVVRFLGFVPFDTLRTFYESATAFVFPSLYEGFGLPPLEAMASGAPVITSSSSSLPEVVGDAAMLVNPENVFDIARGIKEVLLDPELRARLAKAGQVHAAKFSWERTAREVLEVYQEVT
ncbi:MAG: glycosyltransferase family 4 protein, partial [Candidatus Solibacter usitatus]|nr:glycosyltransferase family 4 protein [Candidatus Solibacter usitatus]